MRGKLLIISFVLFLFFAGCGRAKLSGYVMSDKIIEDNEYNAVYYEKIDKDFLIAPDKVISANIADAPLVIDKKSYSLYLRTTSYGVSFQELVLEIYDPENNSSEVMIVSEKELIPEYIETDGVYAKYRLLGHTGDYFLLQCLIYAHNGENITEVDNLLIYTNFRNEFSRYSLHEKMGMYGYSNDVQDIGYYGERLCVCDKNGNILGCAKKKGGKYLWILSSDGEMLAEQKIESAWRLDDCIGTEQGHILCLLYDTNENRQHLVLADAATNNIGEVAEIPAEIGINKLYRMDENILYYESFSDGKVYAWNVKNGKRELFFDFKGSGIPDSYIHSFIFDVNRASYLRICKDANTATGVVEDWITALSRDKVTEHTRITCFVTGESGNKRIVKSAPLAAETNLNYNYKVDEVKTADRKNLVLAELMAGKGPDILYLSRGEFLEYVDQGILADISDFLPKGLIEKILPGALEMGIVSGKLYGLPPCVTATGIMVADDVWSRDTWTLEEMLDLIRNHIVEGQIYYGDAHNYFAPLATAFVLFERLDDKDRFIDWESKRCTILNPEMCELLTLIKQSSTTKTDDTWLAKGVRIAFNEFAGVTELYYMGLREEMEGAHYVGFPTCGSAGNYLESDGIIAVNSNTTNKEAVSVFLANLFDPNNSFDNIPFPDLNIFNIQPPEYKRADNGTLFIGDQEIRILENGQTTVEAAQEFLENCIAAPIHYNEIDQILQEELSAYFSSDRLPEETLGIIQSRIQLFLDER